MSLVNRTKQEEYGLEPKKKFRGRSLVTELRLALADAARLEKIKSPDETTISRMKLASVRIASLTSLLKRKQPTKLKKALAAVERLEVENARLRQELAAALAARPATRQLSDVEKVLAKYEAEKSNGGQ
jgi:hypothetical protein